jgi:hypothetical protein
MLVRVRSAPAPSHGSEGIVREYAVEQIHEDIGVLGKSHDYDGIEGVETVRDLSLALDQLDG